MTTSAVPAFAAARLQPGRSSPVITITPDPNMDLMQPAFDALGEAFEQLGLGLRSIENEWGPGQVECTFAPRTALDAADNVLLFRTANARLPASRLLRDVHGPAGPQRLLFERMASASIADRCVDQGEPVLRLHEPGEIRSPLGQLVSRGAFAIRGARHRGLPPHGERLSSFPPPTRWRQIVRAGLTIIAAPSRYWPVAKPKFDQRLIAARRRNRR